MANYMVKYNDGSFSRVHITELHNGNIVFQSSHYGKDGYYKAQYSEYPIEITKEAWEKSIENAQYKGIKVYSI